MELGIGVGVVDGAYVRRAEELGYDHAWFVDSPNYPDTMVTMTAGALATERIGLGPGVAIPSSRNEYVAANAMASINRIAPGRVTYTAGTGFSGRLALGSRPLKLAQLRHHVEVVRGLLAGETVDWEFEGRTRRARMLNPDVGLIALEPEIPIHVSAFGPRAMALMAEIGDGWHAFINGDHALVCDTARQVSQLLEEAGRDPVGFPKVAWSLGCVLEEGEPYDSPRAMAQAGSQATAYLHGAADGTIPDLWSDELKRTLAEYQKLHETFEPADAKWLQNHFQHMIAVNPWDEPFVTPELMRASAFVGTADELAQRMREMEEAGWTQLTIIVPPGQEEALEDWARVRDMANAGAPATA